MNMSAKHSSFFTKQGKGTFSNGNHRFFAAFEITYYPQKTIIETVSPLNILKLHYSENEHWELKGILNNDNKVSANKILWLNSTDKNLVGDICGSVKFWTEAISAFSKAQYPMVNLYEGDIQLKHKTYYVLSSKSNQNLKASTSNSIYWGIQLEGKVIEINGNTTTADNYIEIANHIALLLSLALGKDIHFNRQIYCDRDKKKVEIWRRQPGYYYVTHQNCIPVTKLTFFLKSALTRFHSWNNTKRKIFRSILSRINSSGYGFIDNRLLDLCIAWETIANDWEKKKHDEVDNEIINLKKKLKKCVDNHEFSKKHDKDLIKTRISEAIDRDKTIRLIESFLDQNNLDLKKLQLNLRKLINIRHNVAHAGRIKIDLTDNKVRELLFNNRCGLQIFLLKELGYEGTVEWQEKGWLISKNINFFLKQSP